MAEQANTRALFDLWKKQIEEGTQAWARMMGQGQVGQAPAPDLTHFWRPFMDQGIAAWSRLLTQGEVSPDVLAQWKQFLDQWIAAWGKALEQAMGTEAFAQALGRHLEQWLALQGPAKKAAAEATEATLAALGIPSRAEVTGIARQLMDLEDRIEGLQDQMGDVLARLDDLVGAPARSKGAAGSPPAEGDKAR